MIELFFTFLNTFYGQKSCKNPLQVLKGGLSKVKETVKKRRESLLLPIPNDTNEQIINMPSHRDALAASLTLQWYVADLDDPCTQKLKAILAGFGCEVRLQES
jgi:hypothetical protein